MLIILTLKLDPCNPSFGWPPIILNAPNGFWMLPKDFKCSQRLVNAPIGLTDAPNGWRMLPSVNQITQASNCLE